MVCLCLCVDVFDLGSYTSGLWFRGSVCLSVWMLVRRAVGMCLYVRVCVVSLGVCVFDCVFGVGGFVCLRVCVFVGLYVGVSVGLYICQAGPA